MTASDLYLIAHKVRGEPAFDVATRIECPECSGQCGGEYIECSECDSQGYWWIVPTSGHRAYPWWHEALANLRRDDGYDYYELAPGEMPEGLPDHYTTRAAPTVGLAEALGLTAKRAPTPPILRRF